MAKSNISVSARNGSPIGHFAVITTLTELPRLPIIYTFLNCLYGTKMYQPCYSSLTTEAPSCIETQETIYQATQHKISEEKNLHRHHCEDLSLVSLVTSSQDPPPSHPPKKVITKCSARTPDNICPLEYLVI